jgi:hypothetical protein
LCARCEWHRESTLQEKRAVFSAYGGSHAITNGWCAFAEPEKMTDGRANARFVIEVTLEPRRTQHLGERFSFAWCLLDLNDDSLDHARRVALPRDRRFTREYRRSHSIMGKSFS